MISTLLSKIVALVAIPVLFFTGVFALEPAPIVPVEPLGVALPSGTATFETSLASPITNSATTMLLSSVSVRGGTTLSGYQCFAIDEGSAQAEFVCGTASSTSITGLERGLSPADGVTETTALKFSHRRGASVKITDFPLIQRLKSQASGSGTYESVLSYANGVTPTGGSELVDVEYLTSVLTGTTTLSYNKTIVNGTAGETLATGTIVYLKASDSRWYKADNDDISTYVDQTLGIAQGAGTSGNTISGGVLTYGLDSTQKGMTGGNFIFLSTSAGATSTATTSQILGKAITATTMFFDQNLIDSSVYVPTTFTGTTTFSAPAIFTATTTGISKIEVFTSSSTWTKPTGAKLVDVFIIGAGGGGTSGSIDTGAGTQGGGGGGGGGISYSRFSAAQLTATVAVTVGSGGAGGTAVTSAITVAGNNGSAGTASSFGSFLNAAGGGAASAGTGGAGGGGMNLSGGAGGNGSINGGASTAGANTTQSNTGGGGGGSTNTSGSKGAGSAGGSITPYITRSGGTAGDTTPTAGGAGSSPTGGEYSGGTGGGGGGANNTNLTGASGGNGGTGGGGGGGAGSYRTAGNVTSGAGGRGGDGLVIVITY